MMANLYGAIALTGGGTGALDKLDGSILNDKDAAVVVMESKVYIYFLDADSGKAEDSPLVIAPNNNPENKRWILTNISVADFLEDYQAALDPLPLFHENELLSFENEILTIS
jgi:hypothetical protein